MEQQILEFPIDSYVPWLLPIGTCFAAKKYSDQLPTRRMREIILFSYIRFGSGSSQNFLLATIGFLVLSIFCWNTEIFIASETQSHLSY